MAGLSILKRLLMKQAMKESAPFQNEGIMSISKSLAGNIDIKIKRMAESAKRQGVDLDKLSEDELKYIIRLNEQPKVISADTPEGRGIMEALLGKQGQVIEADFGKPFAEELKKFRGPVQTKENMGEFGKVNVGIDYSSSIDNPSYFGNAKNMYGNPAKSGPEYFKEIKQFHLNQINRKKKEMVPPTHSNYKTLKKSLQDQEDSLTAAQIAEELGGNENMYDALRTKQIYDTNAKPLKKSDYVKNPIDDDTGDFAQGGRAGYNRGKIVKGIIDLFKKKPKKLETVKDFVDRRQFIKNMVGNTKANEKARELQMLKEAMENTKGYEFPSGQELRTDIEKTIGPILLKDRKLNADGGRIGFGGGKKVYDHDSFEHKINSLNAHYKRYKKMGGTIPFKIFSKAFAKENFADGGVAGLLGERTGFFMGGPSSKGLGLLKQILNYMSKKGIKEDRFKGQNLSGLDMLRFSNPKAYNKMLDNPNKLFMRGREGIMATDMVKDYQKSLIAQRRGLTEKSLDVAKAMKKDQDRIAKRIAEEAKTTIIPQVKKQLMEGMGMSDEAAQKAAEDMAAAAQNIKPLDAPPKITDEGILQLENVLKNMETGGKKKRELNATGGRIGFDKGGMTRRTFLKLLGGLASIPIIGKIVKPIKLASGVKKIPIIKTDNVPGKPEWFDTLVNKVIIEGDDVTKKFATAERQSIHQKTLDDGSVVRVTEDVDDGAVRVEYESEQNVFGDPVQMQYKKPLPDEGDPRPTAEFTTAESGPVGRSVGPDDFDIDVDEVGGTSIRDLDSDVSKLKEYATGQKPTIKEIMQNKKRKDKARAISEESDAQTDAVIRRQGDYVDDNAYQYDDPGAEGFASGGIARMLGE